MCAQGPGPAGPRLSLPQDWSHRHVMFVNGASPAVAMAAAGEARGWQNWLARSKGLLQNRPAHPGTSGGNHGQRPFHRDWAVSLGPTAGMPVGESPAKYTFDVNATPSCANDFVVFPIAAAPGAGSQANLVALNNLYAGSGSPLCGSANPSFFWAYAVGTGPVTGSPSLSIDGTKVVFLENATRVIFHVLTWVAGQGTNATTGAVAPGSGGSSVTSLDYTASAAPGCSASPAQSSYSSPYLDYTAGVAYVGADNGILYRIKNVLSGNPAVDYCTTVSAGAQLTAPVYDPVSGKVFVSDGQSVYGYTPGASSFTAAGQVQIAGTAASIVRPVTVDVTFGLVYVFSSHNLANSNAIVSQMPVSLASHVDAAIGPVPTGTAPKSNIYEGAFDNAYYASGPSAGSLYACGTQSSAAAKRALYRLTFTAGGTMNTTATMANDTNLDSGSAPAGTCSPATEFFDGSKDRLFVGIGGAAGLATDVVLSQDHTANGTTSFSTGNFSTASGKELLLAFISAAQATGGGGTVLVSSVTGAGLTWSLVKRANGQKGTAEIWKAFAPNTLNNQSVTVNLTQAVSASVTVVSYTGVDPSGFGGANAVGASVAASGTSGGPTATLTTTRDKSWVFGVGNDPSTNAARTIGANQTMIHEFQAPNDDFWVQRRDTTTLLSGTAVTINDTAPTAERWNLALVEVLPALAADRMSMWDITTPISSSTTTATVIAPSQIGGTSGVVVDNNSASPQAASLYFGTLDAGTSSSCGAGRYCAVKLTQSALQ